MKIPHAAPSGGNLRWEVAGLAVLSLVVLGASWGLRGPWPPDEQVYALIARDMLFSGDWLIPRVGGDIFQDKPPLLFWLMALGYWLTHSIRYGFLLPVILSGVGTVLLVHDLARRLWGREAALAAAALLLFTVHFTFQAQRGQMDGLLTFWLTATTYCLLRFLFLDGRWYWYGLAGIAAGLGILTKVVGFIPFFLVCLYALAVWMRWPGTRAGATPLWLWPVAPLLMIAVVCAWLLPLLHLINAEGTPQLLAYRDELLFQQTVTRFRTPWHHIQPWYYYLVTIATQWLPFAALLPWLWPHWRDALRKRDTVVLSLLCLTVAVLVAFSCSAGKRDVYILPVLPCAILAAAPYLLRIFDRPPVRWTLLAHSLLIGFGTLGAYLYLGQGDHLAQLEHRDIGLHLDAMPLLMVALATLTVAGLTRVRHAPLGLMVALLLTWLIIGRGIYPQLDASRSGQALMQEVERRVDPQLELGLMEYHEQMLWSATRSTVNFGHRRFREGQQEQYDAARWLNAGGQRRLVIPVESAQPCFANARQTVLGHPEHAEWLLVSGMAEASCAERGHESAARSYTPPPASWLAHPGR
ncbi:MAG: glycosyltransferase family 39 protein [Steroidobacteraceae bacterium]